MASEAVTHGITYRGTDCVTVVNGQLRICLRLSRGLHSGLEVRGTDTVVSSRVGQIERNRVAHSRMLEVVGFVQGVGDTAAEQLADYETAMQEVDALFDPTLTAGALVVALQGGGTATIMARTLPQTLEEEAVIPSRRDIGFRLEAVDPPSWTFDVEGS